MGNKRFDALPDQLVDFSRFLRSKGYLVGYREELELLQIMNEEILSDPGLFFQATRAVLAKNKEQYFKYKDWYQHYWKQQEDAKSQKQNEKQQQSNKPTQKNQEAQFRALKEWLNTGSKDKQKAEVKVYSEIGAAEQLDLVVLGEREFDQLIRQLQLKIQNQKRRTRIRYRSSHKGQNIDFKTTIEKSYAFEGDILQIRFKKALPKKHKLILIADISRSMELYTIQLLKFFYVFRSLYDHLLAFVYSTTCVEITPMLHVSNVKEMLTRLQSEVDIWHGGTRTGISLHEFLHQKGYQKLDKHTTVLILSDGIDTGNLELLEASLFEIKKRCKQILWLNPLMGNPNYKPESKGIVTALPYLKQMMPCHNFEALEQIIGAIER